MTERHDEDCVMRPDHSGPCYPPAYAPTPESSAEADEDGWRSVSESEWQAVVEYRRSREPSAEAHDSDCAKATDHLGPCCPPAVEPSAEADAALYLTDGLVGLFDTLLRKYGGTMKGRGDHDIYDSLVRFRKQTKEYRDRRLATGGGQEGASR